MSETEDLGARNRAVFVAMLTALGKKDFAGFETYLDDNVVCEWAYSPLPGFPTEMSGAANVRRCFERDMGVFTPYNYKIQKVFEMVDPALVIAEYASDCTYLPRDRPYSNQYLGIVTLRDGKIVRWREYVNPLPILEVVGASQVWSKDQGVVHGSEA